MTRAALLCALLAFTVATPSAHGAEFGIVPDSLAIDAIDAEGNPETRAGVHPDRLRIEFALDVEGTGTSARDFVLELPPGLGGGPDSVPLCPREAFEKGEECSEESRVGTLSMQILGGGESTLPIFQLEPEPGELLAFGSIPGFDVPLTMELRPDDFGISFAVDDLPESPVVSAVQAELWGVPADRQTGTAIPRHPFLTLPPRCGPLDVILRVRSWQPGAAWKSDAAESAPLAGCEDLAFAPRLDLRLDDPRADSPTGARVELTMPEDGSPDGLASAQLEDATIELPPGLAVSPGGAAGIDACSDAAFDLDETTAPACPSSSRVGAIEAESSMLGESFGGEVYLGEERPGERFRVLAAMAVPGGTLKLAVALRIDPVSGGLSARLADLPPFPLSRLELSFDGGPGALLASPLDCGTAFSTGTFESATGSAVEAVAPVTIAASDGSPCAGAPGFSPTLFAAGTQRAAGRATTFSMLLVRRPGEQLTRRFAVGMPKGLTAILGDVELCAELELAAAACPAGSRIGAAFAQVGSGPAPAVLQGALYAAGPYRGGPFSVAIVFDAAIGPFDLGSTAVRAALELDPRSGRLWMVGDPLPALVAGVPVRFRAIGLTMDRAGMLRNPTSCAPASFDATFESGAGAVATATSPLAVHGCRRLGLRPHVSVRLTGQPRPGKGAKPGLRVAIRPRRGDTNLRAMRIGLPSALGFDVSGLRELCSRRDAIDGLCSARARVGTAHLRTPILADPLKGSVYVVQPEGDGFPDLWIGVRALGLRLDMRGRTLKRRGRFLTDLVGLPDVPFTRFAIRLEGGGRGLVSLRSAPCASREARGALASRLLARGQNGMRRRLRLTATVACVGTAGKRDG